MIECIPNSWFLSALGPFWPSFLALMPRRHDSPVFTSNSRDRCSLVYSRLGLVGRHWSPGPTILKEVLFTESSRVVLVAVLRKVQTRKVQVQERAKVFDKARTETIMA